MAAVSNVSLSITDGSTPKEKTVTVSGMLTFDSREVARQYRLEIKLFGEDLEGDSVPSTVPAGDDELYTFMFKGPSFFPFRPYTQFAPNKEEYPFTFTRTISAENLNEDSGVDTILVGLPPHTHIKPKTDEVYAKVTLALAPWSSTVNSNTEKGIFGF